MLASGYSPRHAQWPAYTQPKLDGVRCLAFRNDAGEIGFFSRNGLPFHTLSHLRHELQAVLPTGLVLDGELYLHEVAFEAIVSLVKREQAASAALQYWVYDCFRPGVQASQAQRFTELEDVFCSLNGQAPHVRKVATALVRDEAEFTFYHQRFTEHGYEGSMLRLQGDCYLPGGRPASLQKRKDMLQEEFEIVAVFDGAGKEEGCAIFTCQTEQGARFNVRPTGSYDTRREWMHRKESLIGRWLVVKFQRWSQAGKPIFPIGITVRDYE
jgi:ATP-dependent DNA ligase